MKIYLKDLLPLINTKFDEHWSVSIYTADGYTQLGYVNSSYPMKDLPIYILFSLEIESISIGFGSLCITVKDNEFTEDLAKIIKVARKDNIHLMPYDIEVGTHKIIRVSMGVRNHQSNSIDIYGTYHIVNGKVERWGE